MPFSPETLEEKPYNRCIKCPHIGVRCDGPNFLAMSPDRRSEWCRIRKEYLGFTNLYIAEQGGISEMSVARFMSGNNKDMRISTLVEIFRVLVNGTWGQYPCAMAEDQEPKDCASCKRIQDAQSDSQKKIDFLRQQVAFKEEQMRIKDKQLAERTDFLRRKDRINVILSVLLGISVLAIIAALAIDAANPDLGFFWRTAMSAFAG